MRLLGLIGLVLALVIVGLLVKKQMSSIAVVAPAGGPVVGAPPGDARAQSQQIQEQFKQSLDAAMQKRPAMPDDN